MGALWAIAIKDLRLLRRDRANAFFTFVFPLLLALFFGYVFGGGGDRAKMSVALVIEDRGPAAAEFRRLIEADQAIAVRAVDSRALAQEHVAKGRMDAAVVLGEGFQHGLDELFTGGGVQIEAMVDPAQASASGLLTGKLTEIGYRLLSESVTDADRLESMLARSRKQLAESKSIDPATRLVLMGLFDQIQRARTLTNPVPKADGPAKTLTPEAAPPGAKSPGVGEGKPAVAAPGFQPVRVHVHEVAAQQDGPQSSYQLSFPQGVVWGLMGCVTAFGASLANERARGTLMRLSCAPITSRQILLAKGLSCFLACLMVQGLLVAVALLVPALGVQVRDPLMLLVAMVCSALGSVGVMMLMAAMSRTEGGASGLGRAVILVLAMIGGGTIPVFFMPAFMKTVSGISPFRWAVLAIEGGLWRPLGWGDMLLPCAVLIAIGAVGFAIGAAAFKWTGARD
jgi:ABC-2 type transport system permease protein